MKRIGILGSGTWGTAIANMLAKEKHDVTLFSHFEKDSKILKETLRHPNLPGCKRFGEAVIK